MHSAASSVLDEIGLTGNYDFKIRFESMGRPTYAAADPAPSIFAAVEQQLGLKLESATSSFPQFIVESMDRDPTEN